MNKAIYGLAVSAAIGAATFALPASAHQSQTHSGFSIQIHSGGSHIGGRHNARRSVLPERRIKRQLRRQGFHNINLLNFNPNRGVYRAEAHDRYHQHRIVIVDAWTGQIVRTRPYYQNWRQNRNWFNGVSRRRGLR